VIVLVNTEGTRLTSFVNVARKEVFSTGSLLLVSTVWEGLHASSPRSCHWQIRGNSGKIVHIAKCHTQTVTVGETMICHTRCPQCFMFSL